MPERTVAVTDVVAVVLDYRTPAKTLACLQSLRTEGLVRVVLVENSEDGGATLAALRPGLDRLQQEGLAVEVLDEGRNLGFAAGVNLALRHVQAQGAAPVLLLNSDARLEPGALQALRAAIAGGADLAAPLLCSPGHAPMPPVFHYQRYLALLTQQPVWGSFAYITGACMLLAPSLLRPRLFDEDFFFYGEDVMLGATLAREGRQCVVVPEARVLHEGSGSARNGSFFYEYHINRGHWLLARKLASGWWGRLAALLGRLLMLSCRALWRSLRSGSEVPVRAYWRSMTGRPGVISPESTVARSRGRLPK
ncbi:MAG TPA: glycosyltransferase family 2 protein [Burkholderiaceae bacterium]|nr:glycosyltransferase family 2 protein [Burkholderiaceae bacterium]